MVNGLVNILGSNPVLLLGNDPYHPPIQFQFPKTVICGKRRRIQHVWFQKFPWLHYEEQSDRLFCYYCAKAFQLKLLNHASKAEETYVSKGFKGWNRALESFVKHQATDCHRNSVVWLLTALKALE